MALDKQVKIYSVGTDSFFIKDGIDSEYGIGQFKLSRSLLVNQLTKLIEDCNKQIERLERKVPKTDEEKYEILAQLITNDNLLIGYTSLLEEAKKQLGNAKQKLSNKINEHVLDKVRVISSDALKESNVINIFDSVLTRTLGLKKDELTEDVIVVEAFYHEVLENLIKTGFVNENGERFVYYTSSAGQIRNKKCVFAKADVIKKYEKSLMCGLTIEDINAKGGANINKIQAYTALTNSASEQWKRGFNINRAIVVPDFETKVHTKVDYINTETFEITPDRDMGIPIEHTDGVGMILPSVNKKAFQVRLPWIKGLLVPFSFNADEFKNEDGKILMTDIYGDVHDIIEEKINIIFTKSQFKMWKYYTDWNDYKEKFIANNCQAAKLNEENPAEGTLSYQMLQSLYDVTDEELESLAKKTNEAIKNVGSDLETMKKVMGVTNENINKNPLQKALELYPEMFKDAHVKQSISSKKESMIKEARSAKLNVDARYAFIIPDLFAFTQHLTGQEVTGLLTGQQVYCNQFEVGKLVMERSPHLYLEHGVRENVKTDNISKWFTTSGIYTSIHDPISKILMFDVDGDQSLISQNPTLISVAERHMEAVNPLYYEMAKAKEEQINPENIYKSLKAAYKMNIGISSNQMTKVWNSGHIDQKAIDTNKRLQCLANFTIDYAKTLFFPDVPNEIKKEINSYTKSKLPAFFEFAKDKDEKKVAPRNGSTVNRLYDIIKTPPIRFNSAIKGKFDYKMLMSVKNFKKKDIDEEIIQAYIKEDRRKTWTMRGLKKNDMESNHRLHVYDVIRERILEVCNDEKHVVNVLVRYLFLEKDSKFKSTLWNCFGDQLVSNLEKNVGKTMHCEECEARTPKSNNKKYCEKCAMKKEKVRKAKLKSKKIA
ncbi:hypothetical protein [Fictibacillus sp. JL2B1089]|uniref:hypothetical protein n=1 Tax=Fictibacillus sp. JL2B1089 TaxID=3399565 RepID=UPI003A8C3920